MHVVLRHAAVCQWCWHEQEDSCRASLLAECPQSLLLVTLCMLDDLYFSLSMVRVSLLDPSGRWCMACSIHCCQQCAMVTSVRPVWCNTLIRPFCFLEPCNVTPLELFQLLELLSNSSPRHTSLAKDATNTTARVRMESTYIVSQVQR